MGRPTKGTPTSVGRWAQKQPWSEGGEYVLACTSMHTQGEVVSRWPASAADDIDTFGAEVMEAAQDHCDAEEESRKYNVRFLNDDGEQVGTFPIKCVPRFEGADGELTGSPESIIKQMQRHVEVMARTTAKAQLESMQQMALLNQALLERLATADKQLAKALKAQIDAAEVQAEAVLTDEDRERKVLREQKLMQYADTLFPVIARKLLGDGGGGGETIN